MLRKFPDNFIQKMDSIADNDAIKHYVEIMEYIKGKNLKLVLTAYHWPLPLWLHDPVKCNQDFANCREKGWADKATVEEFYRDGIGVKLLGYLINFTLFQYLAMINKNHIVTGF